MARPKKRNVVDYFPHLCDHGKQMFVIEERYQNDGYALWWKLQERLGKHENHWIDFNDAGEVEYLASRAHLSCERCMEIMGCFARVDAIDKDLWYAHGIVWCQEFVDDVADVYRKRGTPIPQRPSLKNGELVLPLFEEEPPPAPQKLQPPIIFTISNQHGEHPIEHTFYMMLVKNHCHKNEDLANKVFYRARFMQDPKGFIMSGVKSGKILKPTEEENKNPRAMRAWITKHVYGTAGKSGPQRIGELL